MPNLHSQIKEKNNELRGIYGGVMTITDLAKEIGMNREAAKRWAMEENIGYSLNNRLRFETIEVARKIVEMRGMY